MTRCLVTFFFFFYLSFPSYAWQGKVVTVYDGDTVEVIRGSKVVKVRLYGIDAPEKGQPFGWQARSRLSELVYNQSLSVDDIAKDRYGRSVAILKLGRQNINQLLVQEGFAWVYPTYCKKKICTEWKNLQAGARTARRGLWERENPTPPWEWRKKGKSFYSRVNSFIQDVLWWMKKILSIINLISSWFG